MSCATCKSCQECSDIRAEKKRLSAVASRARFNEKNPGRMKDLQKKWSTLNKERLSAASAKKYEEDKKNGKSYYQLNKERVLARQREQYAAKKREALSYD